MDELSRWVLLFAFSVLFGFFFLVAAFWLSWWYSRESLGLSPYTGLPLRRATDLSYSYAEKVYIYLKRYHQYDNRPFDFRRAAFCRETGRIFQDCINVFDAIRIDWSFLQKRFPGDYVSWGSLNSDQQNAIRNAHVTLNGFQTEISCPEPSPRAFDPAYIYVKPGPLYVDLQTMVLVGWKEVPDTNLEVLIVQKPKPKFVPGKDS